MARRFKYHRHRHAFFEDIPNLLFDKPHANAPNQIRAGDMSYIRVRGKWSYIGIVMDHYTRKVIGRSFSERHDAALVREALLMVVHTRPPTEHTIFHSDHGSEYANRERAGPTPLNNQARSDNKNEDRSSDPEMTQTKKVNQWYFGMKVHIGTDRR